MKKFSVLALIVLTAVTFTACSKKDKGGGNYNPNGFAPNSCYNSGGLNQYRYVNGACVDSRNNGQPVDMRNCANSQMGFTNDQQCNFTGGYQLPGQFGYGYDACATAYGLGWVTSRGVYGELICVNAATWSYVTSYYGQAPILYNGIAQTCIPGGYNNGCHCRSFGGTLGWFQAGVTVGYCF